MPLIPDAEDCALEPIAIVGMACRLPGSIDSPSALWDLLERKGSGQTPRVPESRFNIDAYLHHNLERPGSFNVPGGYFLDGPLENFDPTFFNMTPVEAMWLDPQQRKMLEVCYECLESAGKSLDSVAGSNTAVFVGSFTSDYQQMSIREPDFRHNYAATGVDPGIISNRIGNMFNLRGPSFTINTACSSSIYAIHNACHALRARDCEAAITGGVNLILTVDQHMNTAKLGILSPTSTCHTFDASADGYGRAEGAGALYLKRLSDAIRDGDPVRGVIRSSAVNTNGKVPGMGITHPSVRGQELVVRAAYERARLNPNNTAYLECHGTGTPVGDPIEVRAVSNAMNDTRPADKPLLVGAIKANIGHSEAASGIFAVMKAAMMTEKGIVPGVCGLKNLNPAIREEDWNVKVQADTVPWPKDSSLRRASVSSFGYGGTNGHIIVESVSSLYPWYHHGHARSEAPYDHSSARPYLVTLSAHDKTTLLRTIDAHAAVADKYYMADLAHTLNTRRTTFGARAFAVAREGRGAEDFELARTQLGTAPSAPPQLGFIFTGQGAQWARMGADAMDTFPAFAQTIQALDRVLQRLARPPAWTLEQAIRAPAATSRINDAEIAQPVCTAVQIAIVDLLAQWQIAPAATVGHSSGEIGAAYAAGLLSAPEAILAAYLRGAAVQSHSPPGAMLAVGLGADAVGAYIDDIADVVVACENSPGSATLSGTPAAVDAAKARLDAAGVFARALRTGKAYHSPQMDAVAPHYNRALAAAVGQLAAGSADWRAGRARMFSSVTGREVLSATLTPEYWSQNLRSRVRFDAAVAALGAAAGLATATAFVEVGPHAALAGPFRQICQARGFERFVHVPTLVRGTACAEQLLRTAGALFLQGVAVDLEAANAVSRLGAGAKAGQPSVLVDLPPYPWNYEKVFWAEPRLSAEARRLQHPRHDLLGRRQLGGSDNCVSWRNVLRRRDVPWLQDHTLGKAAVFPAAGHLSAAIEGLRQISEAEGRAVSSVTLRDVAITTALVIPDDDDGIEIQCRLARLARPSAASDPAWYGFAVESLKDGVWTVHSEGKLAANLKPRDPSTANNGPVSPRQLPHRVPSKTWYKAFDRVGFQYGPSFQRLASVHTDQHAQHAAAEVEIATESGLMDGESRYVLHPSTIDACLQLIIVSIHAGNHKTMPWAVVPIDVEEATLWFPATAASHEGRAVAWTDDRDGRYFNTHTRLFDNSGRQLLDIRGLRCVAYEAAVPVNAGQQGPRQPYVEEVWKPEITTLTTAKAVELYPDISSGLDTVVKTVELVAHKNQVSQAAVLARAPAELVAGIRQVLPAGCAIALGHSAEEGVEGDALSKLDLADGDFDLAAAGAAELDLVIIAEDVLGAAEERDVLLGSKTALSAVGTLVVSCGAGQGDQTEAALRACGFSAPRLRFDLPDCTVIMATPQQESNGVSSPGRVSIITRNPSGFFVGRLAQAISATVCDPAHVDVRDGSAFVVDDSEGGLLLSLDASTFEKLQAVVTFGAPTVWLTAGVNDGSCVAGAMAKGLLRAIRSEQAAARIVLLDFDKLETVEAVADAVAAKVRHAPTKDSGEDVELWLHRGVLHTPRLVPSQSLNDEFNADSGVVEEGVLAAGAELQGRVEDGDLVFTPDVTNDPSSVPIQVTCSELDPTAGLCVAAGRQLQDGEMVGPEVAVFTSSQYRTVVRVPAGQLAPIRGLKGLDVVASLPGIAEAVHVLVDTASVQSGTHVLAVRPPLQLLTAATRLSAALGFRLTVVVAADKEKDECISAAQLSSDSILVSTDVEQLKAKLFDGPDAASVVVASEMTALVHELWRSIPAAGRLVLTQNAIDHAPDLAPFSRGASFHVSPLRSLAKNQPNAMGELLRRSLDLLSQHKEVLLQIGSEHDVSLVGDGAFASAAEVPANAVLAYAYGQSAVKIRKAPERLRFSPDATYLLVGALGGLGRSLASWMVQRGAKQLAFLSRSGADKPESAQVIKSIEAAGATARVFRADASDEDEVRKAVAELHATKPIKGVVHAAMVLQDGMFERMTFDQYMAAIKPKVLGAQSLHKAVQGLDLDFFVMTSSISATLGNPGQANYAAANSYLDALARHRASKGLAATSLILPMVLEVGVVAENEQIEASLLRKGMYGIEEAEMLRGFETAMTARGAGLGAAQIVLGLEPARLADAMSSDVAADAYWYLDSRLRALKAAVDRLARAAASPSDRAGAAFSSRLRAAAAEGPDAAVSTIAEHVMARCSSILLRAVDEFEADGPSIASYGLDSMIGSELRNWLFKEFGLDIPFQDLLAPNMSFRRLAVSVAKALDVLE